MPPKNQSAHTSSFFPNPKSGSVDEASKLIDARDYIYVPQGRGVILSKVEFDENKGLLTDDFSSCIIIIAFNNEKALMIHADDNTGTKEIQDAIEQIEKNKHRKIAVYYKEFSLRASRNDPAAWNRRKDKLSLLEKCYQDEGFSDKHSDGNVLHPISDSVCFIVMEKIDTPKACFNAAFNRNANKIPYSKHNLITLIARLGGVFSYSARESYNDIIIYKGGTWRDLAANDKVLHNQNDFLKDFLKDFLPRLKTQCESISGDKKIFQKCYGELEQLISQKCDKEKLPPLSSGLMFSLSELLEKCVTSSIKKPNEQDHGPSRATDEEQPAKRSRV